MLADDSVHQIKAKASEPDIHKKSVTVAIGLGLQN